MALWIAAKVLRRADSDITFTTDTHTLHTHALKLICLATCEARTIHIINRLWVYYIYCTILFYAILFRRKS